MNEQDIQKKSRDLLLGIAGCEIAKERLDNLLQGIADDHPCTSICEYQYKKISKAPEDSRSKQEFTKAMFHVPEPWNGNLGKAEILFVGSNPSIDLNEDFPKFESEKWSDDEVVKFFGKRLESYKNNYWTGIRKYAGYILGVIDRVRRIEKDEQDIKRKIASRVALTEIVHCKSKGEAGVKKAAKTCFDIHTNEVIDYFLTTPSGSGTKKTVIFVGAKARNRLCELGGINPKKATRDQIANICNNELFEEYRDSASFLLLPYPFANQWDFWKPKDPEEHYLNDERRTKLIDKELEQYS